MAIYRYNPGSLLDSIQIATNATGGLRAYLYAAPGASSEPLRQAKQAMRARGWKCVPIVHEGKPALEVRGFQKNEAFLNEINQLGLVAGTPSVMFDQHDNQKGTEKAKSHPLQLAGAAYVAGDISYLTYTFKKYFHEKPKVGPRGNFFNKLDIVAGFGYALGTLALVKYGARDQSQNTIDAANKKMYSYLRKEGIDVEEGSTLNTESQEPKRGFFASIGHTVSRFPSETLNGVYIFVGLALSAAAFFRATQPLEKGLMGTALKEAGSNRLDEWWDVGLGAVTASSALAGLTIKEKKHQPGDPEPETFIGKIGAWIQEKPLRATGYGFMVATAVHGVGTWKKWAKGDELVRKTAFWRGGFVVANIIAELLLTVSSKGHGLGVKPDQSIDRTVIASTAELILRQPPEKREQLVMNIAGYMSSSDVLGGKAEDVAKQLRENIDLLDNNPWTKHFAGHGDKAYMGKTPEATHEQGLSKPRNVVSEPRLQSAGMANDVAITAGAAI